MYFSCVPSLNLMGKGNSLKSNAIAVVSVDQPNANQGFRQLFTTAEDNRLKELVEKFGDKEWKYIARCMPGRTTRQCRERCKNYLDPKIKNRPWTEEEDKLLKEKYLELGPKWSQIAHFFEFRSDVNIKNRWASISSKMNMKSNQNNSLLNYKNGIPNVNYQPAIPPLILPQANNFIINPSLTLVAPHINQINQSKQTSAVTVPTSIQSSNENDENLAHDETNKEISSLPPASGIIVRSPLVMPLDFSGPLPPLLKKSHNTHQQITNNSSSASQSKQTFANSPIAPPQEQLNEDEDFGSISSSASQVNSITIKRNMPNSHIQVQPQVSAQHDLNDTTKSAVEEVSQTDTAPKETSQKEMNSIERSQQPFSVSSLLFTPSLLTNQASNQNADKGFISIVSESKIDDATLINERENLRATFPNFGGQLW